MANRTFYLHFDNDNDLIWSKYKSLPEALIDIESQLDIKVANGDVLTIGLGNTMPNWTYWVNEDPKYCFGKDTPVSIENGIEKGDPRGTNGTGLGEFKVISHSDKQVKLKHIKSDEKSEFKFDLHVKNTLNGKVTRLIIDPIINNDGTGTDPEGN